MSVCESPSRRARPDDDTIHSRRMGFQSERDEYGHKRGDPAGLKCEVDEGDEALILRAV